jgi:hypothetical protein
MANEETQSMFTAGEVRVFEILAELKEGQRFILERVESLAVTQNQHTERIQQQTVICEGRRKDLAMLAERMARVEAAQGVLSTAMQQGIGGWKALTLMVAVGGGVMALVYRVATFLAEHFTGAKHP